MYHPSSQKPESTWKKEWADPFISPWCLLERFKYINKIRTKDILEFFSLIDSADFLKKASRELYQLKWIDYNKIPLDLANSIEDSKKNSLTIIMYFRNTILRDSIRTTGTGFFVYFLKHFSKTFQYCPKCMEEGYHSWMHQVVLFNSCLFHDSKIEKICPQCLSEIPYELNFAFFKNSFECKCGYKFYSANWQKLYTDWSNQHTPYNSSKAKDFFQIITSKRNKLKTINATINDFDKFSEPTNFSALKLAIENKFPIWHKSRKSHPTFPLGIRSIYILENSPQELVYKEYNNHSKSTLINHIDFYNYSSLCLYQTLKSIIRYLKRTFLKPYKKEIRLYVRGRGLPPNEDFSVVKAYVAFRRDVELRGSTSINVESGIYHYKIRKWANGFPNIFIYYREYTHLVVDIFNKGDEKNIYKWPDMMWVYQHFYGNYILKRFHDWINNYKCSDNFSYTHCKEESPIAFLKLEKDTYKILFSKNIMSNK